MKKVREAAREKTKDGWTNRMMDEWKKGRKEGGK